MNKRVGLIGALLAGLTLLGHTVAGPLTDKDANPLAKIVLNLLAPTLVTLLGIVITPIRKKVFSWARGTFVEGTCRIYLFGATGAGKTTLIENLLAAAAAPPVHKPTEFFDLYSNRISMDARGNQHVGVEMADYKGEKQSQIMDVSEDFAGPKDDRRINAIFFVVDAVPRRYDEKANILDDDATYEWLRTDTLAKIKQRVDEHLLYITKYSIEVVFSNVVSPQLFSVRLVINKIDLIRRAAANGLLPGIDNTSSSQFICNQFRTIDENIAEACRVNGITDYSVHLISAKHDEGIRAMFAGVIKSYTRGESQ